MDLSAPIILPPPGSIFMHTIYAFVIYSQICATFSCEKNENKQKETGFGPFKKNLQLKYHNKAI